MKYQLYPDNDHGAVLMLVVVSSFILSIVGLGSINLMGMQEIQARAELDVVRAHNLADAGIEMAKVWISTQCANPDNNSFPENVNANYNSLYLGRHDLGQQGYFDVSIVPMAENSEPGYIVAASTFQSVKGSYILSSTGVVTGGMQTMQHRSVRLQLARKYVQKTLSPMKETRGSHTATVLAPSGTKVLIAGGDNGDSIGNDALGESTLNTALVYDSVTDKYHSTSNNMAFARNKHTATALVQPLGLAGCVLIVGGAFYNSAGEHENPTVAEIYDPITGKFRDATGAHPGLFEGRSCHTALLMPNGEVFIAGGMAGNSPFGLDTGEIFDPVTESFRMAGQGALAAGAPAGVSNKMSTPRHCFYGAILPDGSGRVLLAGGDHDAKADDHCDLYDPENDWFVPTDDMIKARHDAAVIPLRTGKVLIAGGFMKNGKITDTCELFDPADGKFHEATSMNDSRADIFYFEFADGRILLAGGCYFDGNGVLRARKTAEVYDPYNDEFANADDVEDLFYSRRCENNSAVRLKNGDIVIFGGWSGKDVDDTITQAEAFKNSIETTKIPNSYSESPAVRAVP